MVKKRPVLTDKKLKYDEIKKIIKFHKLFQMKQTVIKRTRVKSDRWKSWRMKLKEIFNFINHFKYNK